MSRILKDIPEDLENQLFKELTDIRRKFFLGEDGDSELNGGRMAECLIRIFQYLLKESVTPMGIEISGPEKIKILSRTENDSLIDKHIRTKVTKLVSLLLGFRNDRDVAHLGGFDANKIDSIFVLYAANWVTAELVRVYGKVNMKEAQRIIDELAIPNYPAFLEIEGESFLCKDNLNKKEQILAFLFLGKKNIDFLFKKVGYSRKDKFENILKEMEKDYLIAFKDGYYHLLSKGQKKVIDGKLLEMP